MNKIKSIVVFKISELVIIARDGFPYSNVWVKEPSAFSNDLQSIFPIVLRREDWYCCKWDSGARNVKLIQLQYHIYIVDSANLENYAWSYVHEDDWDQDGVLLETLIPCGLWHLNILFEEGYSVL